jgi:hypothetical protein
MSATGCGLSACTLNRRFPWLHFGCTWLRARSVFGALLVCTRVVANHAPWWHLKTFRNAHIADGTSSKHLTCTSRLDSVDYHATVARALVKLSSPLDNRPRCPASAGTLLLSDRISASGRWHLSLASAHRGLARCAVGVEPRLWSVVVDTLSEQSRFLVYRPSCVCVHLLSDRISSRISLRASANRRLDARGAGWACGASPELAYVETGVRWTQVCEVRSVDTFISMQSSQIGKCRTIHELVSSSDGTDVKSCHYQRADGAAEG